MAETQGQSWRLHVPGVLLLLFGASLYVMPRYIFPVCGFAPGAESLVAMRCAKTAGMAAGVAVFATLVALVLLVARHRLLRRLLWGLAGLSGVVTILVPTVLAPVCGRDTMPCVSGTRPALIVAGAVCILLTAVALLVTERRSPMVEPTR